MNEQDGPSTSYVGWGPEIPELNVSFHCQNWYNRQQGKQSSFHTCYPLAIEHNHWKWPFIVSSSLKMVIFHVLNYRRAHSFPYWLLQQFPGRSLEHPRPFRFGKLARLRTHMAKKLMTTQSAGDAKWKRTGTLWWTNIALPWKITFHILSSPF